MQDFDIAIAGGGLAGMTLAAALAPLGLRIALIDAGDPLRPAADDRTTALSYGARRFYERIGVWPLLAAQACPIRDIRVLNGARSGLLDFASAEIGDEPFGHIVENDLLKAALAEVATRPSMLTLHKNSRILDCGTEDGFAFVKLADGREIRASLLVAADGRMSACRQRLGIPVRSHSYGQIATICTIAHELPHRHLALENFYPGGPFAVLPMQDLRQGTKRGGKATHRSSIVWTERSETAQALKTLPAAELEAHLQLRIGGWLERVRLLGKPAAYPLGLVHALRYSKGRALLLGDAAHGIHPIAGQGFNLTIRDIALLTDAIAGDARARRAKVGRGDFGSPVLMKQYEKMRRLDNLAMIAATDTLDRLFSNSLAPVSRLRGIGLALVNRMSGPRHFFMRQAMGMRGRGA